MLRNVIPDKVRIPAYVMIIAAFVTVVDMVMAKFLPDLHKTLGLYIPLIVVNCIIMARAEAFSNQNAPLPSVMDGLGTGIGFTLALTVMGIIREFLGAGSFFGIEIPYLSNYAMTIFIMPAGALLCVRLPDCASLTPPSTQYRKRLTQKAQRGQSIMSCTPKRRTGSCKQRREG